MKLRDQHATSPHDALACLLVLLDAAQVVQQRRGRNAGRPDEQAEGDCRSTRTAIARRTVAELLRRELAGADLRDVLFALELDALGVEVLERRLLQVAVEAGQDRVGDVWAVSASRRDSRTEYRDARQIDELARVDRRQVVGDQIAQLAGQLDARRAAADDYEVQQVFALLRGDVRQSSDVETYRSAAPRASARTFEQPIAHARRVFDVFEEDRMLGDAAR